MVKIEFGFDLQVGSTLDLVIEYAATPKKGLYFRGPNNDFPNRFVPSLHTRSG